MSRAATLLDGRAAQVARGVATTHPIFAARAQGTRLWDVDGAEYLDFVSGIGVLAVGHNHPRVVQAVRAQLERLTHSCFQVAMYEPYIRLAERLNTLVGGSRPRKTVLLTTGAEAVENAVKVARAYTNRPGVIAFSGGFHGRTLLTMSLTGMTHAYKQNFVPFAPELYRAPYPYEYRGWTAERSIAALMEMFETQVRLDRIAAIIIEPELGDGGFVPAHACSFFDRCAVRIDGVCDAQVPPLRLLAKGSEILCHRTEQELAVSQSIGATRTVQARAALSERFE